MLKHSRMRSDFCFVFPIDNNNNASSTKINRHTCKILLIKAKLHRQGVGEELGGGVATGWHCHTTLNQSPARGRADDRTRAREQVEGADERKSWNDASSIE